MEEGKGDWEDVVVYPRDGGGKRVLDTFDWDTGAK